nr:zinc ribbon domain-containing protein [Methylobacterium nodulans]
MEERGGYLLTVDPRHTSQTCTNCGVVEAAIQCSHSQFECVSCGH